MTLLPQHIKLQNFILINFLACFILLIQLLRMENTIIHLLMFQ